MPYKTVNFLPAQAAPWKGSRRKLAIEFSSVPPRSPMHGTAHPFPIQTAGHPTITNLGLDRDCAK